MTAERSEAGTHLSPANAGPKASLNRPACSKNQSMQTGTLVVPEGGLNAPSQRHHDPRSVESSSAQPVLLDRRGTPVAAWPLGTKRTPLLVLYLFFFRITSRTAWTNFERKWMRSDIRSEATSRPAGQPEGCPLHLGWSGWGDLNSRPSVPQIDQPQTPDLHKRPETIPDLQFWLITGSRRFALFRDVSRPVRGLRMVVVAEAQRP